MNYKLVHRSIAAGVLLISAIQYIITGQPSLSFWDPGELSAAANLLQVPHPPGGPLFLLVGRIFYLLPIPGDPGFRMNMVSFLATAFSSMFLYLVAVRIIENYRGRGPKDALDALGTYGSAAVGALAFSFCDTVWFNGAESNYFAASTVLFSSIVWLLMVWLEKAESADNERYILMMAYLVGLAAGVHLMSVLTMFSVGMVVYLRRYVADDEKCRSSALLFLAHAVILIGVACVMWAGQTSGQPPASQDSRSFDLKFVVAMGAISLVLMLVFWKKVFNRSSFYIPIVVGGVALFVTYPGIIKLLPDLLRILAHDNSTEGLVVFAIILGGLGSFAWWAARRGLNTVHLALMVVLVTILGVTTYTMIIIRANDNPPMNENDPKTFSSLVTYLNREQYGDFPIFKRRYSQQSNQQAIYTNYSSDLDFLAKYQLSHMFTRYILQNFVGRQSFDQDTGVDWTRLYAIPFLIGLAGLYFHFRKDWKMASALVLLFLLMGPLTAFYQNQQEPQPRDREYFYAGAYFIFCVWIAIGTRGILSLLQEKLAGRPALRPVVVSALVVVFLAVPVSMARANWFTHDRSRNWLPHDYAYNQLQSCPPNAVLFTNGDNDTFPLWFMQDVEGVRRDVRVVCLSLLNTNWYIKQLKNQEPFGAQKVAISYTDAQIDRFYSMGGMVLDRPKWTIPVPPDAIRGYGVTDTAVLRSGALSFSLSPTLQAGSVKAIRVQDIMVKDIIEHNTWDRPICFALTCSEDSKCGTGDYLRVEGLAARLVPQSHGSSYRVGYVNVPTLQANLFDDTSGYATTYKTGFKFRGLHDPTIFYDENESRIVRTYCEAFVNLAMYRLSGEGNGKEECIRTLDRMQQVIRLDISNMDYIMLFNIATAYQEAGGTAQFNAVAPLVERSALKAIARNPKDAGSYFSPYRFLVEIYDRTHQYGKAADLLDGLVQYYPKDAGLKTEIDRYRSLARLPGDSTAPR